MVRAAFGGVMCGVGLFPPLLVSPSKMRITFLMLVDAVPFQIELIESQFGGLPTQEAFMALT